jgi:hypothetical protein
LRLTDSTPIFHIVREICACFASFLSSFSCMDTQELHNALLRLKHN